MFDVDSFNSSNRAMSQWKNRIYRLIGRASLKTVSNSKKVQLIQVDVLDKETISDMERFQEYGLETYPKKDAEVLAVFPAGNRDQGVAVCVMDSRYRPTDLKEGEVQFYDWNESKVYLKSDKSILISAAGKVKIEDKNGSVIELKNDGSIMIDSNGGAKIELKTDGSFRIDDTNGNYIKSTPTQIDMNGNLTVDM